ncbi:hypothetical protein E3E31_00645 [Thermococcus sp. M39]|uniref:hypothetical protein n=1 Tax=unclassified Thermococcus TaxID=2627626 RepID=UPI00169ADD32|nr:MULTISPECIES: hypothetical protein [unclassified Thermococcus]NJE07062.1 hypothetical protein [Thermococcus sp. M39]NJE13600.1 hypothetical protein [Thermococcus sp. LS2]
MNRKTVSLLIVVLMVLSVVPATFTEATNVSSSPTSMPQIESGILKLNVNTEEPKQYTSPMEKIDPKLLEILKNKTNGDIAKLDSKNLMFVQIVATEDIERVLTNAKIQIVGRTEVAGMTVYLVLIPVKEESEKTLLKIASIPQVKAITRPNPFEPIGKIKEPDAEDISENLVNIPVSKYAYRVDSWKPKVSMVDGIKVSTMKSLVPEKLRKLKVADGWKVAARVFQSSSPLTTLQSTTMALLMLGLILGLQEME